MKKILIIPSGVFCLLLALHACNTSLNNQSVETNVSMVPDYPTDENGNFIIPIKIPKNEKEENILLPQRFILWKLKQDRSADPKFYKDYAMDNIMVLDSILSVTARTMDTYDKTAHAKMLIQFVQHIPYVSDKTLGYNDRPLFPVETISLNGGDCEDKAILLFGLLNRLGIETVFVQFPNHVMLGSCWEDCEGYYVVSNKQKYFLIETTAPGEIGKQPMSKCMNCYSIIGP